MEIDSSCLKVVGAKNYRSCLDEDAFQEIRVLYQIPTYVCLRAPSSNETANSFGHNEVCFYESIFEVGLRFPISRYIRETLFFLNLAPAQLTSK